MYQIGDKIVYPIYGAGIIEAVETKEILGQRHDYYVIKTNSKMKVMVPIEKCDEAGIRHIIEEDALEELFETLKADSSEMPDNWNRRYRQNMEKIKTGDILQVAEVVRNIYRIEQQKSLSSGEKKLLEKAMQIIASEVAFVKNITQEEAEKMICEVI